MASPKPKRDNEYYRERLRKEHPDIYADYQARKFKNLSEALIKAGIRKKRTELDALKSAWNKASKAERDAFKAFIGCAVPTLTNAPASTSVPVKSPSHTATATSGKGHLPPALRDAVKEIMKLRRLKSGQVMREIGRDSLDGSLGMALNQDTLVQDSMIADLEAWAARNKSP